VTPTQSVEGAHGITEEHDPKLADHDISLNVCPETFGVRADELHVVVTAGRHLQGLIDLSS